MVWSEGVEKIVMLTQIKVNRKLKCQRYFPEFESSGAKLVSDLFRIDLIALNMKTEFIYHRKLRVTRLDTNEVKIVNHYQVRSPN